MGITQFIENIGSELTMRVGDVYNAIALSQDRTVAFFVSAAILLFYIYILVLFYKRVSKRDMFRFHIEDKHGIGKALEIGNYIMKNIMLFPAYTVFWFLFISYSLIFLSAVNFEQILLVAALVLAVIRGLAYLDESASVEMAKLLPLMFVSAILLDPAVLERQPFPTEQVIRDSFIPLVVFYLKLIILFEIALRLVYDLSILIRRHSAKALLEETEDDEEPMKKKG